MSSVNVDSIYLSAGQWLFQDWLAVGIVTHLIAQISLKLMSPLNTFALTRKQFLTFFKLVRNCYAIKNKKCPDENCLLYVVFISTIDVLYMVFLRVIIKVINLKWQNGYDMSVEEIMKLKKMVLFYIYWHRSYRLCGKLLIIDVSCTVWLCSIRFTELFRLCSLYVHQYACYHFNNTGTTLEY